jgi:hypothetical protein
MENFILSPAWKRTDRKLPAFYAGPSGSPAIGLRTVTCTMSIIPRHIGITTYVKIATVQLPIITAFFVEARGKRQRAQ